MKHVLGISAFGLKDCVAQPEIGCRELGFYLADAVLPMNPFGRVLIGDEAEEERIHAGLYWPPEARILEGEPLRRVPIPYAWRALVESGDRTIRWKVGKGVSFTIPRILASHVRGLVAKDFPKKGLPQRNDIHGESQGNMAVVAIPDNLDEFGQEVLIREFTALGLKRAILVWRPVAAALSWLSKVEGDFPSLMGDSARRMGMNDHIHVIYLGPDAFEFTTFRMRVKKHEGQNYVLPLRDRPADLPNITGIDWAGRLIEESFEGIDQGAFWQAFTNFPEIWRALAGRSWNQEELPRAWNRSQEWTLWNPSPDLYNQIYNTNVGTCDTLRNVLRISCRLESHEDTPLESIGKALQREVRRMAEVLPEGRLRGMIVCGPLVPRKVPPWLGAELETLSERGLKVDGNLTEPEANRLWICSDCDDPIAEGAAIYGRRTLEKIPSYLDTMPQLSILAQKEGKYEWVSLLNAQEVLGGTEFKDTIQGRFQLDKDQWKLHVYLNKGSVEDAQNEPEDPFDAHAIPLDGITPCQARLVREIVRKLGSMEAVQKRSFFQGSTNNACYGIAFAKALFTGSDSEDDEPQESSLAEMAKTPLRRAVFDFPSAPDQDVGLDVEVRMRPASGLAKVELVPEDVSFLQGGRVRLNYPSMRKAAKLPRHQRGWPRIQELVVDPSDGILHDGKNLIEIFENTPPKAANYTKVIDKIRDVILKRTDQKYFTGLWLNVHAIDQNGQACTREGNDMIRRIAIKFEGDFSSLDMAQMVERQDTAFSRASWLYTSTPHNVIAYVKDILASDYTLAKWRWAVEAASRTFVKVEDLRILFEAIDRRVRRKILNVEPFPIQSARAICRVLIFRKDGEKGLNRKMAQLFAQRSLERLHQEQDVRNFKILYFQLVLLLLYLLRYRRSDPSCFDPNLPETIEVFENAMESMDKAKRFFSERSENNKAKRVQNIIDGFEKYLHYEGTEDVLTVLGDFAGDMA